jgi:hypothetical protein
MIIEKSKKQMLAIAAIAVLLFISIALVESFALETNTDRPGMDYNNYDLPSANPSLCEQACNSDPDCKAFTYVKPGVQGPKPRCWLKNGIPTATPNSCCDSGVKGSTGVATPLNPNLGSQISSAITGASNTSTGVATPLNPNIASQIGAAIAGAATTSTYLTGVWNCDDGGMYYIRQFGTTVWWFGEHDRNTPDWSNVMRGTISGNMINADWTDVPKGSIMQYGMLKLQIQSNNKIVAISKTGGFAGSVWTRIEQGSPSGVQATPIQLPGHV